MKIIILTDLAASGTGHHHTHSALKQRCQQLELSPVLQTQPPTLVPAGNFPYAKLTKHYKCSPPSLLLMLEGLPAFDSL